MKPIFIIGYMASGKTTFGSALAKRLELEFIDLDDFIEEIEGMTISEIFNQYGEDYFRSRESEALRIIAGKKNTVVSCGGGTPCFNDNISLMKSEGLTVRLEAGDECLLRRLADKPYKRPLIAGKSRDDIKKILLDQRSKREAFYKEADIVWDGERLENENEIDSNITDFIAKHIKNSQYCF